MTTKLYDVDFSKWAVAQADHLRNEEYAELDLNNLIEEIEDMAQRHRDALENDLFVVLHHLLKLYFLNQKLLHIWLFHLREFPKLKVI